MSKGGGPGPPQHQTSVTTSLPEYVQPYFTNLIERAQTESDKDYVPYEEERIAGLQPEHERALAQVTGVVDRDVGGAQIRAGSDILSQAGQYRPASVAYGGQTGQVGYDYTPTSVGYTPGQFTPGYTAAGGPAAYQAGQIGGVYDPTQITSSYAPDPSQFTTQRFTDPGVASAYMDPFIENVINRQQARARRQFSEEQIPAMRAQAERAGAYGGSRDIIGQQVARARLEERLGDIESTQRSQAYREGRTAFARDREEAQRAQQMRDAAARAGGQLGLSAQQATAQEQRAAAQLGLTGQQAQEQARARAAQLGLQGYETQERARQQQAQFGIDTQKAREQASQQAAQVGLSEQQLRAKAAQERAQLGLGVEGLRAKEAQARAQTALDSERLGIAGAQQRAASAERLAAMGGTEQAFALKQGDVMRQVGDIRAAEQQQQQDLAYADFLSQRDYPKTQMGWMGGILHGVPVSPTQESTVYRAQPPVSQQLMGFGLGGASILNQLGKG